MIAHFLRDTPERSAELRRQLQEADWASLARSAHMLAGSCGIFGLAAMRQACLRVEELCGRRARDEIATDLAGIEHGYTAVQPALARLWQGLAAVPPAGS